jgi:ATP-dependent DNA ligase
MNKTILYQKSKTGKTKTLEFWTSGSKFYTRWGQLGGKMQETVKVCEPMNEGKANATTGAEQATAELKAKVVLKNKEGYVDTVPSETDTILQVDIDLDNIPEAFCPNKPISKTPETILNNLKTYGQRKHDGHCLFLVKGNKTEKIYSRRMEDRTEYLSEIPTIKHVMSKIPKGAFLLTEMIYTEKATNKEKPRFVAQVVTKQDKDEALSRYKELSKVGTFDCIPFDILFHNNKFVGNYSHMDRFSLLDPMGIEPPELLFQWKKELKQAEKNNWEGLILRLPGEKSHISYTMDGEAHRAGSYKYKFLKTDDFFITEWLKGISGKHANFYAKFKVAQYDSDGKLIDRGYVGPGKLSHEELEELTTNIDNGKIKKNFVVEVEYQDIQDSGKLQFGIIQRLRPDKVAKECVAE